VPDWWRYGLGGTEQRHYKELINLGYYNLTYRPFFKIEGTFDGTTYQNNNDGYRYPVSFTPKYRFEGYTGTRLFVLTAPLKIDLVLGRFDGKFREVYHTAADGRQEGDDKEFRYIF